MDSFDKACSRYAQDVRFCSSSGRTGRRSHPNCDCSGEPTDAAIEGKLCANSFPTGSAKYSAQGTYTNSTHILVCNSTDLDFVNIANVNLGQKAYSDISEVWRSFHFRFIRWRRSRSWVYCSCVRGRGDRNILGGQQRESSLHRYGIVSLLGKHPAPR